jgi:hypothetical protein
MATVHPIARASARENFDIAFQPYSIFTTFAPIRGSILAVQPMCGGFSSAFMDFEKWKLNEDATKMLSFTARTKSRCCSLGTILGNTVTPPVSIT